MSDSNRTQLYYKTETTWGGGAAAGNLQTLRFTSESLGYNLATIKSQEIRSDRQTSDLVQTSAEAGGDINFEMSFGTYDDLLKAALYSSGWSTTVAVSSTAISVVATTNSYDSTSYNFVTTSNIAAGQWIKVAGFTTTGNNGYALVSTVATNKLTISAGLTLANEAIGDTVTIKGARLRNGTTETSVVVEKKHDDITQFFSYLGMVPNSLSLNAAADSILTGTLTFVGKSEAIAAVTIGDGSPTAATTTDVLNTVSNVGQILEGSTLTELANIYFQSLDFALTNNVRGIRAIGSLPHVDLGVGSLDVTGTVNAYFYDSSLYTKFINNTDTGLSFKVEDTAGNAYIFTFHRVKFSSDKANIGGLDQDVIENLGWTALRHATYDCMIQIDKFAA